MTKNIVLVDYKGDRYNYQIENFEEVDSIQVTVISGDEVVEVRYENGNTVIFDCGEGRLIDFYDGSYIVPKKKIETWSNTKGDAYDREPSFI